MDNAGVQEVRRFNRTVTQRIGILSNGYLARRRPIGASRLLWEIGPEGSDVRSLRARLELDSGYVSRLLRSLEDDRLVKVVPEVSDRRVRTVLLTKAGRAERELLVRLSDDLAWSLLEPLTSDQRSRLIEAMGTVERLLTAGMVHLKIEDPTSEDAQFCIRSYFAELDSRFESGFDPQQSVSADAAELTEPAGLLLIARLRGEPVGCGALKMHGRKPAEVKRMWIAAEVRGLGLGRRILEELERHARQRGIRTVRLETNRSLNEAVGLYKSAGYREAEPFSDEPYADHWFEKVISA
ncbi:MAG: helix-turn-helix domain-containing GNAT family N-acetyltransferase [Acidimicrobiales bacterium]